MDFCNKMDFLMKLVHMKNKELAAEMSVDRSLISLLRTGKRKMPQNELHIRHMAQSFAKRVTADYQRRAIAEISGLQSFRAELSSGVLALELERWLIGGMEPEERIPDGAERDNSAPEEAALPPRPSPAEDTLFFRGDNGKREALRCLIGNTNNAVVLLFDNTDMSWIYSDPTFAAETEDLVKSRGRKADAFTQILPPLSSIGCYADSLRFLLPVYSKGNAQVYCSTGKIEAARNITLIVVPGQCALYSYSISSLNENVITVVSTNKDFINANAEQFREYLSVCKPALTAHKDNRECRRVISDFFSRNGDVCLKTALLPVSSMSAELAIMLAEQCQSTEGKDCFRELAEHIPRLERRLADRARVDICALHSAEDIRAGRAPVACPYKPNDFHLCYTPETYALHLKNILRLMDTYKEYSFIPVAPEFCRDRNLLVNDGGMALMSDARAHAPMIVESHRPEIVMACREHLMRIADKEGGAEGCRERVKSRLCALIGELGF